VKRRRARALIGSIDALDHFDALRAPKKRSNRLDVRQFINRIDFGVFVGA